MSCRGRGELVSGRRCKCTGLRACLACWLQHHPAPAAHKVPAPGRARRRCRPAPFHFLEPPSAASPPTKHRHNSIVSPVQQPNQSGPPPPPPHHQSPPPPNNHSRNIPEISNPPAPNAPPPPPPQPSPPPWQREQRQRPHRQLQRATGGGQGHISAWHPLAAACGAAGATRPQWLR